MTGANTFSRRARGWAGAAVALGLAAASVLVFGGVHSPAHAATQPVLKVAFGHDGVLDAGPLVGAFPTSGEANPEPSDCTVKQPYCDNIPFDVTPPPGVSPGDDWYVVVSSSWEPTGSDPSGNAQVDDIDTFTYDDGQLAGGTTKTYTDTGDSASGANPEVIKLYKPQLGRYNLVLANFSGANEAYHVRMHMVISKFDQPFELLAPPPPAPRTSHGTTTPTALPNQDTSSSPTLATPPSPTAPGDVAVIPDQQLSSKPKSTFNDELAAPPSVGLGNALASSDRPPGPVSGLALILAFLVAPGILVAGLMAVVRRQRRALFTG
jgi:hypothetical protein